MRRVWRRHRKKIAFAAVAAMLFFAAAEIVLRATGAAKLPAEDLFTDAYDIGYLLIPGATNPWTEVGEFLNAAGFRGPTLPRERKPGVKRIICLGDSTTFGVNVPFERIYSSLLQDHLQAAGVNVEVMNAGMPGAALWKQMITYDNHLQGYAPDLLVLYSNYGYREDFLRLREDMEDDPLMWFVRRQLARLHIYRGLRLWLKPPRFANFPERTQYGEHPFIAGSPDTETTQKVRRFTKKDLAHLDRIGRRHGTQLMVVPLLDRWTFTAAVERGLQPGPAFDSWHRASNGAVLVGDVARNLGLPTLDAASTFLPAAYKEPLFLDDVHFNEAGHALMAELLAQEMCRQGLLDCPDSGAIASGK
jgi:lysophospholipase L1-like esterase